MILKQLDSFRILSVLRRNYGIVEVFALEKYASKSLNADLVVPQNVVKQLIDLRIFGEKAMRPNIK